MGLGGAWFVGEACCEDDQVEVVRGVRETCCDEEDQVEVVMGVREACCDEDDQVKVVRGVREQGVVVFNPRLLLYRTAEKLIFLCI